MAFLIGQQFLEQVLGDIVAKFLAELAARLISLAGIIFARQVGLEHFLDGLADAQRRDALQVRMTLEEDDALDKPVGVMHLLDGFRALLGGEALIAPIVQKSEVNPVLVDRAKFEKEGLVKPLDDLCFAFHDVLQSVAF